MRINWTREEVLLALLLYVALPATSIRASNSDIIDVANAIGRSPDAVKAKIWNISSFDERRLSQGMSGLNHSAKLDGKTWQEFIADETDLLREAVILHEEVVGSTNSTTMSSIQRLIHGQPEGADRIAEVVSRVNQEYFRNTLLCNYDSHCCLTEISSPQLLVASHIKPWADSDPKTERLDPCNGLLLNALHDKAFDKGLITIDDSLRIRVSPAVKRDRANELWLWSFDGVEIHRPLHHSPAKEYIEYHNDVIFQKGKKAG